MNLEDAKISSFTTTPATLVQREQEQERVIYLYDSATHTTTKKVLGPLPCPKDDYAY